MNTTVQHRLNLVFEASEHAAKIDRQLPVEFIERQFMCWHESARYARIVPCNIEATEGLQCLFNRRFDLLGDYMARCPEVELDIALCDRTVDLIEEGFEAAIRIGSLPDSGLIARPLIPYRMMICASPDYIARHGEPQRPEDLSGWPH